jgi:hypothetical protein
VVTITVASLTPPCFALLAERYSDPESVRAGLVEEAETRTMRDLGRHGWVPVPNGLAASHGVAFLRAERAFSLPLDPDPVAGDPPRADDLARAVEVVAHELGRYPPALLRRAGLRRVLFCASLRENDAPITSLPNYEHSLLLEVGGRPAFLGRLVHHEVFHFLDYAVHHRVGGDGDWTKLNDPFFVYGCGGRFMRQPGSAVLTDRVPGFLSRYATSAPEEDQAEVFSFLMSAPRSVAQMGVRDAIVRAKVARIQARVRAWVPELGDGFWPENRRR